MLLPLHFLALHLSPEGDCCRWRWRRLSESWGCRRWRVSYSIGCVLWLRWTLCLPNWQLYLSLQILKLKTNPWDCVWSSHWGRYWFGGLSGGCGARPHGKKSCIGISRWYQHLLSAWFRKFSCAWKSRSSSPCKREPGAALGNSLLVRMGGGKALLVRMCPPGNALLVRMGGGDGIIRRTPGEDVQSFKKHYVGIFI